MLTKRRMWNLNYELLSLSSSKTCMVCCVCDTTCIFVAICIYEMRYRSDGRFSRLWGLDFLLYTSSKIGTKITHAYGTISFISRIKGDAHIHWRRARSRYKFTFIHYFVNIYIIIHVIFCCYLNMFANLNYCINLNYI